jgi:hypothetical protein
MSSREENALAGRDVVDQHYYNIARSIQGDQGEK